jgi:hypothetical protein
MRDAQNCFLSQPISHGRPVKASGQLADAQILFRRDFTAYIARLCSIRVQLRLTQDSDKSLSGSRCVLNRSETPGVEIAQAMGLRLRSFLKSGCLIFLEKPANWTSRLVQNLQYRLISDELTMCSHLNTSAKREPPHTARSPKRRLPTA